GTSRQSQQPLSHDASVQEHSELIEQARKVRSRALTFEGQQALKAQKWDEAERLFTQALMLDANNTEAQAGLAETREQLTNAGGVQYLLDEHLRHRRIRRDAALAEYEYWMHVAQQAMNEQKFERASQAVTMAELTLERNRQWLDQKQK